MTAYISFSFNQRVSLDDQLTAITDILRDFDITPLIFADRYTFGPAQEKEMMLRAMNEIDNCDLLIAETSDKAIGIGIEVGYAKAKNKPVIYLRHSTAEHSTTTAGISDYQIIYSGTEDLKEQLTKTLNILLEVWDSCLAVLEFFGLFQCIKKYIHPKRKNNSRAPG